MVLPRATVITPELIKKKTGEYDLEVVQWLDLRSLGISVVRNSLSLCSNLVELNLSHNKLEKVEGLDACVELERLFLASNRITSMCEGLRTLQKLEFLDLKDNLIADVGHVSGLSSLGSLKTLHLQQYGGEQANPVCKHPSYHSITTRKLPRLEILDGESTNLRDCMAGVVLEQLVADPEVLRTPEPERWCKGFEWDLPPLEDREAAIDDAVHAVRDLLRECSALVDREMAEALGDNYACAEGVQEVVGGAEGKGGVGKAAPRRRRRSSSRTTTD